MSGRWVALLLVGFAAVFGAALWYFQTRAYYRSLPPEAVQIGVPGEDGTPIPLPLTEVQAIDAETSPLKFRACFRLGAGARETIAASPAHGRAEPLVAPGWFSCFDARSIARDLAAGRATALLGAREIAHGADRVLAIYPDGRGFAWHQLSEEFLEK